MASRNLSLTKTARQLGINRSSLHSYCNGVLPSNLETIQKLADFFGISPNELVYGEGLESVAVHIVGKVEGEYLVTIKKRI